ncbi:MAG: hypothetical protein F4213_21000, partial [Boseongicola sp. SB0677_bin_26]|nr:hypothetical protein [Boseongicola sp. SB0677_bin_26]
MPDSAADPVGRAVCARRERRSRLSLFGLRRPAGPASSPSLPRFLSRLPRAAARLALALLLLAGAGVGLSTEARAQTEVAENWSLKPSSVVAGEQFRLLIVTSTTRNAQSSTIGDYDTHVQNAVAAGHTDIQSYSSGFKAVGCTGSVDARDHTSTTYTEENLGIPIFYLDGDKVADNYKDFYDGTWNSQSPKNESGNSSSATRVWTGCESDGTEHSSYPLGDSTSVQRGNPSSAIRNFALSQIWTSGRNSSPLYGLSGVFQVAGEANTGPSVESAEVTSSAPKELVIDFDETLDTGSVPSASAFTVKVGGSAGPAVSSVAVSGDDVTLGLAVALDAGQTNVTVDYAKPGSNPLQSDADSEEVASFTNRAVTNNAPACPTGQPAAAFWTACLTVGAQSTNYGYDTNFGALSDGSFTRNGVDFAIIRVMNSRTGVSFVLIAAGDNFSPVAGAVLQVDGTRLALADATQSPLVTGRNYLWASPGFTWTSANVGDKVSVSLRPNAAPTASDNTVETDEDGEYTFDAADFGFMDTDPSAALASVKIVSVETAGDLQLGGAGVTADEVVTKTDLDDGELVFTPVSGEHGSPYATFTFKVNDGTDDSDDAYTMTIDVDSVPDTTGVSVTSTPRSGSGTEKKYGEGETIQVTVTFDEAVDVTGDPHVDVQVGSNERDADYESGSGSTELVFEYEVLSADRDTNGISISADDLQLDSDDEIQDGDGNDASVSFSATGNLGGHKVDGSLSDTTAPSAVSASVGRGTVTILFDEPLDSGSVPARTAFSLKRTRSGTEGTATLTGTPSISGATVTLEIASASAVLSTDTALKVAYAKPGSGNKLEDAEGNEVADFTLSGNKVTNDSNSPPTSADTVVGISEDRASVFGLVSFDAEYNDPDGDPLAKVVISEIEFSDEWRGQLSLAGVPLSAGTGLSIEVTRAQLLSTRDFAITPAPDFFGEAAVKITYRVNDGTEDSADSYVMTVDVANVNDEGTGRPEILGELVRMTALQAGKGTMADVEGLPPDAELRWQWVRQDDAAGTNEEDIPGATGPSYWLEYSTRENGGKWLAVKVTYEDGGGTEETLKSEAIGPLLRSTPYSGKGHHLVTSGDCRGQAFPPGAFWTGCLTIGKNTFGFTSYGFGSSTGALDNPIVHHEGEDYEFTSFAGAPNTNYVLLTLTSETRNEPVVRSWVLTIGNHAPSPLTQYFASTSTGQLNFDAPIWDDSDVGTSVVVSLRPSDMTAPRMVLGWALDRTVTLAYDEPLREGRVPEKGAYTARVAGRPVPVETVAVAGREVTLRLAESAGFGTVDVRYEPWHRPAATWVPRGKPLEDLAGNEAAGFGWRDVANVAAACGEAILGAFWESCALLQGEAEGISARLAETGFEEGGTSHAIESVFKATGGAFSVEFAADPGAAATGWELVSGGTVLKLSEATKHPTLPAYTWNPGLAWTAADIGSVRRLGLRPVTSLSTAVPGAPQADATPGDGEARIDWTAPEYDGTITGWQFRQGAVASPFAWGGWTDVEGATAETASHTVTGLENGTTYLFQVRAMAGEVAGAASNRAGTTPVAGAVLSPKMSVSESESRGNPWDGQSFSFRRSTESGGARGCAVEVTVEFLDEDGDAVAVDALAASDFTVRNGRAGTPVAAADGLSWTVPARANAGFTGLMRVQLAETARWRADEQVFRVASDTECAPVARNALRRLALEGLALDPAFDAATTAYAASAPADMAEVTVTASAVYGAATVAYAPADADGETEGHQVALPVGETEVTVTVTPPGGEAEDAASWTVTVTRAAAPDPGPLTGFVLVDASDDADLGAVADGGTVTVSADGSYGIRAEVGEGETVGSVKLRLEGPGEGDAHERTENVAPYSLHGDANGGREHGRALAAGSYTLTATAHSGKGGAGDVLGTLEVSFTAALEAAEAPSPSGPLTGFVLVDASDDADLGAIADGGTVTVSADGSYGIRA